MLRPARGTGRKKIEFSESLKLISSILSIVILGIIGCLCLFHLNTVVRFPLDLIHHYNLRTYITNLRDLEMWDGSAALALAAAPWYGAVRCFGCLGCVCLSFARLSCTRKPLVVRFCKCLLLYSLLALAARICVKMSCTTPASKPI